MSPFPSQTATFFPSSAGIARAAFPTETQQAGEKAENLPVRRSPAVMRPVWGQEECWSLQERGWGWGWESPSIGPPTATPTYPPPLQPSKKLAGFMCSCLQQADYYPSHLFFICSNNDKTLQQTNGYLRWHSKITFQTLGWTVCHLT